MLDIVASYHCMQIQRKLLNQNWEYDKKSSFGPDFGPFGPNSATIFFFFFPQKSGFVIHQIPWSAIIKYNIRKN